MAPLSLSWFSWDKLGLIKHISHQERVIRHQRYKIVILMKNGPTYLQDRECVDLITSWEFILPMSNMLTSWGKWSNRGYKLLLCQICGPIGVNGPRSRRSLNWACVFQHQAQFLHMGWEGHSKSGPISLERMMISFNIRTIFSCRVWALESSPWVKEINEDGEPRLVQVRRIDQYYESVVLTKFMMTICC